MVAVRCSSSGRIRSYLWNLDTGFRRLEDVLNSIGANISDTEEIATYAASFDGSTLTGVAFASGTAVTRPWIARLPQRSKMTLSTHQGGDASDVPDNVAFAR